MAWREPAGALEYSDDEELPYTQKENWAGKVMLSPPRHRADPYDLERSPLDDLHDLNVRVREWRRDCSETGARSARNHPRT